MNLAKKLALISNLPFLLVILALPLVRLAHMAAHGSPGFELGTAELALDNFSLLGDLLPARNRRRLTLTFVFPNL
jgi:hypothetical protein